VVVDIGERNEQADRRLWESLPPVYRQCAVAYTNFWSAYGAVFPSQPHQAVGKKTGLTSYIERFNKRLRQRVSRLVKKAARPRVTVRRKRMIAKTLYPFLNLLKITSNNSCNSSQGNPL
jgi:IS1 family transposase